MALDTSGRWETEHGLVLVEDREAPAPLDDPVNIASPEFKANPYPFYARLRAWRRSTV